MERIPQAVPILLAAAMVLTTIPIAEGAEGSRVVLTVNAKPRAVESFGMLLEDADGPVGACLFARGEVVACADGVGQDIVCGDGMAMTTRGGLVQVDRRRVSAAPGVYNIQAAPFFFDEPSNCVFEGVPMRQNLDYDGWGKRVTLRGKGATVSPNFPAVRGVLTVHATPQDLPYRVVLTRAGSGGDGPVTCDAFPGQPLACSGHWRAEGGAGSVKLEVGRYAARAYVLAAGAPSLRAAHEGADGSGASGGNSTGSAPPPPPSPASGDADGCGADGPTGTMPPPPASDSDTAQGDGHEPDPRWKVYEKRVDVRGGRTTSLVLVFRPA